MAVFKCFQQLYWIVKIYRITMHYTVYTDFMFCMEYLAMLKLLLLDKYCRVQCKTFHFEMLYMDWKCSFKLQAN